ncbi:MAG: DUF2461 domain-containing protein [Bacteroidota bacterium]
MSYFTNDFLNFFKELSANNNREWFKENKKRYEAAVKEPFHKFIVDVIDSVHGQDTSVMITAKDAIFRIYRDVRFSKDKSPYKNHCSAVVSPGGRKDKTNPGLYLQINHEALKIFGGVYYCDKDQLRNIRSEIAANPKAFEKVLNDKAFVEKYGGLHGETNKRLPSEFVGPAQSQPLIFNKQFYYFADLPAETLLDEHLLDTVMTYYNAGKPMKNFLSTALHG